MEVADSEGFTITQAAETHIHADFASGIRDVAEQLNANVYVSGEGDDELSYRNMPEQTHFVNHQDIIHVGNIKLEVLHTPGHTLRVSVSYSLMKVADQAFQWVYLVVTLFLLVISVDLIY